jgi:hypothetical protein
MHELSTGLREVTDWAARHDAACTERNKAREKFENRIDSAMQTLNSKVSAVNNRLIRQETRQAFWSALGALLGAAAITALSKAIGW